MPKKRRAKKIKPPPSEAPDKPATLVIGGRFGDGTGPDLEPSRERLSAIADAAERFASEQRQTAVENPAGGMGEALGRLAVTVTAADLERALNPELKPAGRDRQPTIVNGWPLSVMQAVNCLREKLDIWMDRAGFSIVYRTMAEPTPGGALVLRPDAADTDCQPLLFPDPEKQTGRRFSLLGADALAAVEQAARAVRAAVAPDKANAVGGTTSPVRLLWRRFVLWLAILVVTECVLAVGAWRWGEGPNLWQRINNSWEVLAAVFGGFVILFPFCLGRANWRHVKSWLSGE